MTAPLAVDIPIIDDVIGGAEGLVTDAVQTAATDAADAAINATILFVFALTVGAVETVTEALITAMETTSSLDLTGNQFASLDGIRATVLGLSLMLLLGHFLINVLSALTRGEPGPVVRAAFVDLPAAAFTTSIFTTFTWALLRIVDGASAQILGDVPEAIGNIAGTIVVAATFAREDTATALIPLLFAVLWIIAALLVWAQLLIRSALILIVIVLAPLGYASRASAGSRQLARRSTEILVALIASKLGIALAFGVGSTLVNSSVTADDAVTVQLAPMFTGCIVLLLAAFMPWMLLKAIPVMEGALLQSGSERSPLKAAGVGAGVALTAVNVGRMAGTSGTPRLASRPAARTGGGIETLAGSSGQPGRLRDT
jgi:hypothetical protein